MTDRSAFRTLGSDALLREAGDTSDAQLARELIAPALLSSRTPESAEERQLLITAWGTTAKQHACQKTRRRRSGTSLPGQRSGKSRAAEP